TAAGTPPAGLEPATYPSEVEVTPPCAPASPAPLNGAAMGRAGSIDFRAPQEHLALAGVAGQAGRRSEFAARLVGVAGPGEQIRAYRRKQVVGRQRGLVGEPVDQAQPRVGPGDHGDRDGVVERDDRGTGDARELFVERDDGGPVGL